jgi:hypothetical protein
MLCENETPSESHSATTPAEDTPCHTSLTVLITRLIDCNGLMLFDDVRSAWVHLEGNKIATCRIGQAHGARLALQPSHPVECLTLSR